MRRSDREIKDRDAIIRVMEKCDVCRLAIHDTDYPYILPLNFGIRMEDEKIVLYFHGADKGTKYELLRRDNRVSFEMDCAHRLVTDEEQGTCTMEYESVIGKGRMEFVTEEEKYEALCVLMRQYHREDFAFDEAVIPKTTVMRLVVEDVTGKQRKKMLT